MPFLLGLPWSMSGSEDDPYELTRIALKHPFLVALVSGAAVSGSITVLTGAEQPVGLLTGAGTACVQLVLWMPKFGLLRPWAQRIVHDRSP